MKITEYTKKDGTKVYRSQVYLGKDAITNQKVKTSVSARTKKEVKLLATQKRYEFKQNGSTKQEAVKLDTFKELSELWLESYKLTVKPQTYENTMSKIRVHIWPYFGNMKPSNITASMVQSYLNKLSKYHTQFPDVISIIRRILQHGVILDVIRTNPARDVILPRRKPKDESKIKFIDRKDLKAFLDHTKKKSLKRYNYYYEYVLYQVLLSTGMRIGEVCALEWSDIDFENGTIEVNKTYNKHLKYVSTAKTKAGMRTISIGKDNINLLKLYKVRQGQLFKELGAKAPRIVFSTPTRDYFDASIRQEALKTNCKQAGVPRFTFHAFRHTHASLLINAGMNPKELQHRLGHANISMTLDIYSHISKETEKESVSYFEKAINSL